MKYVHAHVATKFGYIIKLHAMFLHMGACKPDHTALLMITYKWANEQLIMPVMYACIILLITAIVLRNTPLHVDEVLYFLKPF